MAAPLGVVQFEGAPSSGRATVVRTVTRPAEAKGSLGSMPVLVNHASSLSPAEPCGPLIPSNVRPPQCPAISGECETTEWKAWRKRPSFGLPLSRVGFGACALRTSLSAWRSLRSDGDDGLAFLSRCSLRSFLPLS